ncbi:hypothetical protein GpartN1_g7379.t1 [Galdieria partita]|uniref:FMR1-interacting protein 1 conserved domain-containing protein n=1 Tax=Galdieria partita TaxID=83374 RepID=A0A9C7Q343_9RHOD|nr:hypothetical protein GpartN1_g7379.t1 [Galdieria partita]
METGVRPSILPRFSEVSQPSHRPWSSALHNNCREQYHSTTVVNSYTQWKPWGKKRRRQPKTSVNKRRVSTTTQKSKESPEEIARYIEERRRKWPSAKRVEQSTNHTIVSTHNGQLNALQLVAQVYDEKTEDSPGVLASSRAGCEKSRNNPPKSQGSVMDGHQVVQSYRPNLYTLFVQKHVDKQHRILLDFIGFLHREKFLQNS